MTREQIEKELLAWMSESPWRPDPDRLERLALALFRFQYAACEPYARLCRSFGRTPDRVGRLSEIPAVPTGAFKEFDLRCFEPEDTRLTFRTSGTALERRGQLHLDTTALYEASLLSSLRELLLPDLLGKRPPMRFLAPSPAEAPDSSLTYMFEVLRRAEGAESSGFDLRDGALAIDDLANAVARAREDDEAIVLAGTSFAFVHFLDATDVASTEVDETAVETGAWRLPEGSRVMETGGFKGRSREVPRDELRRQLASRFGLPETSIINQYGMTELGSQFYDSTLVDPEGPRRKLGPPWTAVRFVDPDSGLDVADGEVGMVVIHDLANTGSLAAIQTADLGRRIPAERGAGFDILGRASGAEQRGCSIASDVMLDAAARDVSARQGDA